VYIYFDIFVARKLPALLDFNRLCI